MAHRILLCLLFFSIAAQVRADQVDMSGHDENWGIGVNSDEGASGSSYLGVDIADITSDRLASLKLKEEHGAEVTMVDQDAPAGKAGLREHDVILSLNGTTVDSAAQLRRMIRETPPGRIVTLGISRDGQPLSIKIQLGTRQQSMTWPGNHEISIKIPPMPSIPDIDLPTTVIMAHSSLRSGLMVENITPQLGDFFGVRGGKGVLVRSVEKGSRGDKAGFHAGDVIVKVNQQTVNDASDFVHALRGHAGGTASIVVVREKREQTLTLTLPDRKDSSQLLDSFELPEINVETQAEMRTAQREMARLGPEMERLQHEMQLAIENEKKVETCPAQQRELERQMREQQKAMTQFQQRMQEKQKEFEREQKRWGLTKSWAQI